MKKLIEELKEAIALYEKCEDVCAAEHIMMDSMLNVVNKAHKLGNEMNNAIYDMIYRN